MSLIYTTTTSTQTNHRKDTNMMANLFFLFFSFLPLLISFAYPFILLSVKYLARRTLRITRTLLHDTQDTEMFDNSFLEPALCGNTKQSPCLKPADKTCKRCMLVQVSPASKNYFRPKHGMHVAFSCPCTY